MTGRREPPARGAHDLGVEAAVERGDIEGDGPGDSLKAKAVRGGAYLMVRQIVGAVIRALGLLVLTRALGPTEFGRYAGPLAIVSVVAAVARLGVEVYLIRRPTEPEKVVEDQAFTVLLISTAVTGAATFASSWWVGRWVDDPQFGAVLRLMAIGIPINVLWVPAQARLERGFQYRRLGMIEVVGDLLIYVVALPLALAWPRAWAPAVGYLAWQVWLLAASYVAARYRPRLVLRRAELRDMLGYGITYAPTSWMPRFQDLINPFVVGRYLSSSGVGVVALVLRLIENLSLVVTATGRLAHVALARIQDDTERLRRAHRETMLLQTIGTGVPLALFALTGGLLVPLVFGKRWEAALVLFPLVAFEKCVDTLFNVHAWVLSIKRRNLPIMRARIVELVLFIGTAVVAIPRWGVIGFGIAGQASLLSYAVLHGSIKKLFRPGYRPSLPWLLALMPALAAAWAPPLAAPILAVPLAVMVLRPSTRCLLLELRDLARPRPVAATPGDAG